MQECLKAEFQKQQVEARKKLRKQHRNHKLMTIHETARRATKMYLSVEQMQELENVCGAKAAWLHSRYVDMAEETNSELHDIYMANILNWSLTAVQRARRILEKQNWFRKITGSWGPDNLYSATYYLLDKKLVLQGMSDVDYIAYLKHEKGKES
jgi:hypothetical protein